MYRSSLYIMVYINNKKVLSTLTWHTVRSIPLSTASSVTVYWLPLCGRNSFQKVQNAVSWGYPFYCIVLIRYGSTHAVFPADVRHKKLLDSISWARTPMHLQHNREGFSNQECFEKTEACDSPRIDAIALNQVANIEPERPLWQGFSYVTSIVYWMWKLIFRLQNLISYSPSNSDTASCHCGRAKNLRRPSLYPYYWELFWCYFHKVKEEAAVVFLHLVPRPYHIQGCCSVFQISPGPLGTALHTININ